MLVLRRLLVGVELDRSKSAQVGGSNFAPAFSTLQLGGFANANLLGANSRSVLDTKVFVASLILTP